eukprot:jgi/Chlat1/3947/Chrsp26S04201
MAAGVENVAAKDIYFYAKSALKSSAVLQAICGRVRDPAVIDVVLGKETVLELLAQGNDGCLHSLCEQSVFGTIRDLKLLPWTSELRLSSPEAQGKDLLVLLSDSGKLSFVTFSNDLHRFLALSQVHLSYPGFDRRELGRSLAIEQRSRAVAVSAFQDRLSIFPITSSAGDRIVQEGTVYPGEAFPGPPWEAPDGSADVSCPSWGTVWSMAFIACDAVDVARGVVKLAIILHRPGTRGNEIQILSCWTHNHHTCLEARFMPPGLSPGYAPALAIQLVPTAHVGMLLVICEGCVLLLTVVAVAQAPVLVGSVRLPSDGLSTSKPPFITAWEWEANAGSTRLITITDKGNLHLLQLTSSGNGAELQLGPVLYTARPCNQLLWLAQGCVAAFVELGDGVMLQFASNAQLQHKSDILNTAPLLDFQMVDFYSENQDQIFAGSGVGVEGSIRVIRNGNKVELLLSSPPQYAGVTGVWSLRLRREDTYHSYLVMTFVDATRVLSVGLSFDDITELVGFNSTQTTIACGRIQDHYLVQVCGHAVRLTCPLQGRSSQSGPYVREWALPDAPYTAVKVGAVGATFALVSMVTIKPNFVREDVLAVLRVAADNNGQPHLVQVHRISLQAELSCISVPVSEGPGSKSEHDMASAPWTTGQAFCVVGTYLPSVELLVLDDSTIQCVASTSLSAPALSGAISNGPPESVRFVQFDSAYILVGLRSGGLLRYEIITSHLSSPPHRGTPVAVGHELASASGNAQSITPHVTLRLAAVRRIGVSPVSLIPLAASPSSDVVALSDRPWLLQAPRRTQCITCTSISFQPSTHATAVSCADCPNGVLFIADSCVHLVAMEQSKRLNVQKLPLGATPRRVLYHNQSKLLVVACTDETTSHFSMMPGTVATFPVICGLKCVDPVSGRVFYEMRLKPCEVAFSLKSWTLEHGQEYIVAGTALGVGTPLQGERGRLLLLRLQFHAGHADQGNGHRMVSADVEPEGSWDLQLVHEVTLPGMVCATMPYLNSYLLASAGRKLYCLTASFDGERAVLHKVARCHTRLFIAALTTYLTRIVVVDVKDSVLFYTYREDSKQFELEYCDRAQRLVADCALSDSNVACGVDRHGNFFALTNGERPEGDASTNPDINLVQAASFSIGESALHIREGSLAYRTPEVVRSADGASPIAVPPPDLRQQTLVAATLLGSIVLFLRLPKEEYDVLRAVEHALASYPITAPVLGNSHIAFRSQAASHTGHVLDGDMLAQFLELPDYHQRQVLNSLSAASHAAVLGMDAYTTIPGVAASQPGAEMTVEKILALIEHVHSRLS